MCKCASVQYQYPVPVQVLISIVTVTGTGTGNWELIIYTLAHFHIACTLRVSASRFPSALHAAAPRHAHLHAEEPARRIRRPPVAVREALASLDRVNALMLLPARVQVRLPADNRLAVRANEITARNTFVMWLVN